MGRISVAVAVLLLCSAPVASGGRLGSAPGEPRTLTFEDRVAAEEAIGRVYYRHQLGATKPFEEAMPRALLEERVRKYLQQTVALETYWKTGVTAELLDRELDRMVRGTRLPDRLQELFEALHADPFLIKETLARATLVDRLTRSFYAFDPVLHGEARRRAEALRRELARGELDPRNDHPGRSVVELVERDPGTDGPEGLREEPRVLNRDGSARRVLSREDYRKERARLPEAPGGVGPAVEVPDAFVVRVLLREGPRFARFASYAIPKESWDPWWNAARDALRFEGVSPVANGEGLHGASVFAAADSHAAREAVPCGSTSEWGQNGLNSPSPRTGSTAVWTGSVMIIWGGDGRNTGGRYDPATDTLRATSILGAPTPRANHTAVWTGNAMLVWGGDSNTGGKYDPTADTWSATSTQGAPSSRAYHTAIWTGSEMVVWGGSDGGDLATGGRYDPDTDAWTPTSMAGVPSARSAHTAVWTGSTMVVWGGSSQGAVNTGGRYNPTTDSWTPTSTVGAPASRAYHTAVWTGTRMVVWGGDSFQVPGPYLDSGGRYNPVLDTWAPTSTTGAPSPRSGHTAVWTGSRVVIWGGQTVGNSSPAPFGDGGRYDPGTNTWSSTSTTGAPAPRWQHSAVWTGSEMVVWGGMDSLSGGPADGGRYNPVTDSWTAIVGRLAPSGRSGPTSIWTGSLMLVWGGYDGYSDVTTGARYDPATDTWTATSTTGVPMSRFAHSAVWTGSEMVVWGGYHASPGFVVGLRTGARYNPLADSWTETSTTDAPSERGGHAAVWTGHSMVVWGGNGDPLGGRYDPATDTWTATSTIGAPPAPVGHAAVWTGSEMVVWGGHNQSGYEDTGGRYDPVADTWMPLSTVNAPLGRTNHSAVWTGTDMVVWGGRDEGLNFLGTGGRYNPLSDSWRPTSLGPNVPSPRRWHTTVWTGTEMIVWGGVDAGDDYLNTGSRYRPTADTWMPTSAGTNVPAGRASHGAVWTGTAMIVWGGWSADASYPGVLDTGGEYVPALWSCDDGIACTADICQPATGCTHISAPGLACDDGNTCTTDDACDAKGGCIGGHAVECSDADPCTIDSCSPATGCGHAAAPCRKFDFAPPGSPASSGFVKDDGSVFSSARGLGWDVGVETRARGSANPLALDTFAFSRVARTWTAEVENGDYEVCLASGDPSFAQGPQRVHANGVPLIDDATTLANEFASSCQAGASPRRVQVRAGQMRVTIGGTSGNTLINDLRAAPASGVVPALRSISFQPVGSTPAAGFELDHGKVFDGARGYGWDAPVESRERNQPVPQVLDTFVFSSAARTWELSLASGDYDIWYGLGDATYAQGPHRLVVEGVTAVQGTSTTAGAFLEGKIRARVEDGSLTVAIGGGGGANTILDYVVVVPADGDADGVPDEHDDCPSVYDPEPSDTDGDGVGYVCDNCPYDANPSQSDADQDGTGDACDGDDGLLLVFAADRDHIVWQAEAGAASWNVYEGDLDVLRDTGAYTQAPGSNPLAARRCAETSTRLEAPGTPPVHATVFFLVAGVDDGVEGSLGQDSRGFERLNSNPCP